MQLEGFQADSQVERNAVKMEFHTLYADWGGAAGLLITNLPAFASMSWFKLVSQSF